MLTSMIDQLKRDIARNLAIDTQRSYDRAQVDKKKLKVLEAAQAKLNKIGEE